MTEQINIKLQQTQQGMERLRKVHSMLEKLNIEQLRLENRRRELEAILEKENEDIYKLEQTSLASLFYLALGRLDERVDKERQEALAAKLKYDQAEKDLADVQARIAELAVERDKYAHCPQEFEELYKQRKEELIRESGETAHRILKLEDGRIRAGINLQEINEAIAVGEEVLASLKLAEQSLDRAGGWGTWDLLGGGLIAGLAKHSNIDDAQAEIENAQRLLSRFKSELTDIDRNTDIVIEIGDFAKFADFFFDGLIADWFMQSKITQSRGSVLDFQSEVSSIVQKLEYLRNKENSRITQLEIKIKETILKI